ncbi:MAG: efflux RND transporter permease subunit [Bacteriovoracaceae bacterium]
MLIKNIIKYRLWVIFSFITIGIGAVYSLKTARVDAIPDIGENQQIVFTSWPGRSPKDVEQLVTYPLSVALQGIPGVKAVRGNSAFGISVIYIVFKDDIDFYWSRSRVLEKISTVQGDIPEGAVPKMGPDATGLGQVYWYTIENEKDSLNPKSLQELRAIQDFHVRYLFQSVEGVSEVASIGGFVKEYQVDVDPKKIFAFNIHFSALIKAIENSNMDVGAEVIEDGDRELIVRGKGFFKSISDIENVVVSINNGSPVRIKDLATVSIGPSFRRGALDKNGNEAVGGVVTMRYGENPKIVIDRIKNKIKEVSDGLPKGVKIVPFYDRTEIIQKTLNTVYKALSEEIIVTSIVIFLFLLHLRASFLVAITLPFGVGISFILMKLLGAESNVMSLAGLVISIGSMVDMGIIMTENIYTHLSEKPNLKKDERLKVIIKAAQEVSPPIMIAILTIIVTFLPVFGLEGSEGKLFHPLAYAKTLAMIGSSLVALVLIPALASFFLKGELRPIEKNKVATSILRFYRPVLKWVLDNRGRFLILPLIILLYGGYSYTKLGKEFMPSLNEGEILYMPVTVPDISITKARELLSYTDREIRKHPLVQDVVGKLGRVESAIDPAPVSMFETLIKLVPEDQWPSGKSIYDIMNDLDEELQVPGLVNAWLFPIENRIGMISTGIKTQVGVKIFGPDLKKLEQLSHEVGVIIKDIEGAYGVYSEKITGKPYIEFDIDRIKASRFGINVGTVNKILQTAVGGMAIGTFYEGRQRYPIRLRYKKEMRDRIDELKRVLVPSPLGQHIPIDQLADIKVVNGPAMINSENGLLRSTVLFNVRGSDLIGFVEKAKETVNKKIKLPQGYSMAWAGQYENQQRANQRLLLLIPIALIINILIAYFGMGSLIKSTMVFSSIPLALCGGLILLNFGGFNTSVAVWVGFISLFGLAVEDGLVMMTYLEEEVKKIKPKNFDELKSCILEAGSRRIRPFIMTSATTILALLPVIWATTPGSEVIKPMAIPTLGGMTVALVSLFIVPVFYSYYQQKRIIYKES